jgi:hypothetical protein
LGENGFQQQIGIQQGAVEVDAEGNGSFHAALPALYIVSPLIIGSLASCGIIKYN